MLRLLCLFCFFSIYACNNHSKETLDQINDEIEDIRKEYVQDKRTALFRVEAKNPSPGTYLLVGETIFPSAKKALLNRLAEINLNVTDSLTLLPAAHLNGKNFGIVNLSVSNIRSKPKHSAELATQALLGTPLRVYKKEGSFYFVQTPDNYLGWLDDGGFTLMDQQEFGKWKSSERAVCLHDYVFAYESNDTNSPKVTDLLAGSLVQVLHIQNEFTEIGLPDGRSGYTRSSELMPYPTWLASRQATAESVLSTAREMMGRPYLWGGTSGKGMDCSGFTKTVFHLNGIQLERDASLQVHTGAVIETDTTLRNLVPGDLLFFGEYRQDGSQRISHVAIYMGNGRIIHASERVRIESIRRGDPEFNEYRLHSFMEARRILGQEGQNGIIALKDSPFY